MFREKIKKFHFVGIGGVGMSGIAQLLLEMGYEVSGSDLREDKRLQRLRQMGAKVFVGHCEENLAEDVQVVVYSSAVPQDNPELLKAKRLGIPVIPRGEMLAELFRMGEGIAVCGSHGKTTTTSMIAHAFHGAGFDPTVLIGGVLQSIGSNAKLGKDRLLISEADESDGSFLRLFPTVAVITNIDKEHLGFYKDLEEIRSAFLEFANLVPFYGFVVINHDDPNCRWVAEKTHKKVVRFGLEEGADIRAKNLSLEEGRYAFDVYMKERKLGRVHLGVPGKHNVYNALACISVCLYSGIDFEKVALSLSTFKNAERRLELKGYLGSVPVYDDYGHHPTEIKAVLDTLREVYPNRRLVLAFQPHRYSRTYYLFEEFAQVLKHSDLCLLTDIYPASEENIYGVSSQELAQRAGCLFCPTKEELFSALEENLSEGDVLLFMGAGSISKWCEEFMSHAKSSRSNL
ncbi:MAG: UDP-N-acetylmuramate--L-alanine ligase [Aquificota bacterium]|nr:MAG: UDP-N-acetylmuramate--L-alanine ligase [Aquificota bacterium]